jgi:beta-lactam-binding protein with PASTA domain
MRVGKVSMVPASTPGDAQAAPAAPSEPNPASMIVTQTPPPGQKIVAGTAVNFEVR